MSAVEDTRITSTQVEDSDRMAFLPDHFPDAYLAFESALYDTMSKLSPDYTGAYWEFYTLDNDGWYCAPNLPGQLRLVVEGNGYAGRLSADAAGIVATLFAFGAMMWDREDAAVDAYHALRDFAIEHAEGGSILAAID